MEYIEDTQGFYEDSLPDFSPLILMKITLISKLMNMLRKEGTSQITIHPLQCMLVLNNIKSKI